MHGDYGSDFHVAIVGIVRPRLLLGSLYNIASRRWYRWPCASYGIAEEECALHTL